MTEPSTVNRALVVPLTGDLVASWGTAAVNPNFTAIDGMFGGSQTVSLTNVNVTLSVATGTITASAGPTQSDNAKLKFTGTLSGNVVVTFPCPGYYIVQNLCTVGAFYVQARAAVAGNVIGLPPGQSRMVFNDGTNFEFVDMPPTGTYHDFAMTATPAWMTACTVRPFLLCDGTVYSSTLYTALFTMVGSTFGGNGINTFGVPDIQNKVRIALGTTITTASGGFNGNTFGASGGTTARPIATSNLPASIPYTDAGHFHSEPETSSGANLTVGIVQVLIPGSGFTTGISTTNITINPGSPNTAFPVIQPTMVCGQTYIAT
jgi:microcystin-dependent protein